MIAVFVVNVLPGFQLSPKMLFHNPSVLADLLAIYKNSFIFFGGRSLSF